MKRKVGLLSAGEPGQPPLAVSLLSDQRGRIFGGYYTLADYQGLISPAS
jgi:hypothetical protein